MSYLTYEHLRVIWWLLLGVLLIAFAIMDGFELGTGILLPFVAKTDGERRVVINTVGPVWEGNQVWLILGGGAIFAAWPLVYAVAFSGFYLAMLLVLCALILRPAGFKYRSKIEATRWRDTWDWLLFLAGLIPALIFGVAVGNALLGAPFTFDDSMRMTYHGNLFGLLTPFALLCGLVSVAMLTMHGGTWLAIKTDGVVAERARNATLYAGLALILLFALAGLWVKYLDGYKIVGTFAHDAPRSRGRFSRRSSASAARCWRSLLLRHGSRSAPSSRRRYRSLASWQRLASACSHSCCRHPPIRR
jgi:cytochrome d ubiquinol oxidase subunit II